MTSLALQDWVAEDSDGYLDIARKFAAMPDRLKSLRHELPARVSASAVGNAAIFTKAIETAYRAMWVEYCRAGDLP